MRYPLNRGFLKNKALLQPIAVILHYYYAKSSMFVFKWVFIVLIFCTAIDSFSQSRKEDSLLLVLNSASNDTAKVDLLATLGRSYQYVNPSKAMLYAQQSLDLAKKAKYQYGVASALNSVAALLIEKGDYLTVSQFLNQSLEIASNRKEKRYKRLYGRIQSNLGVVAQYQEDHSTSINHYLAAAGIFNEFDDDELLLVAYYNLSFAYSMLVDKENALKYAEQCYAISKKINDPYKTSLACVAVASAKIELKNYENVEKYLLESEKISSSLQSFTMLGSTNELLGQLMVEGKKDYKKGIKYYEKALLNLEKAGNQYEAAFAHQMLGEAYFKDKNYNKAKSELSRAMSLSKQLGSLQLELYSLKNLSEVEEKIGNRSEALELLKQYNIVRDSFNLSDKQKKVKLLETKHEMQLKEVEIAKLQTEKQLQDLSIRQKNTVIYVFVGAMLVLAITGSLFYINNKNKRTIQAQKIKELEQEKQLVAADSILKGQQGERSRMAQDLHDGLGSMLSSIKLTLSSMKGNIILTEDSARLFTKAFEQLDSSIGEMRRVAHNMMPEALVKLGLQQALQDYCDTINESKQLHIDSQFYGLEKRVEATTEIIIYRIVQELVNNSIKHAHATSLLVQVMKRGDELNITVEDNGVGFSPDGVMAKNGAGLNNIRSRVDYLKGQMDIQSTPGTGTSVHIDCRV
jgi:two-component system, NarL family, sensor kinase